MPSHSTDIIQILNKHYQRQWSQQITEKEEIEQAILDLYGGGEDKMEKDVMRVPEDVNVGAKPKVLKLVTKQLYLLMICMKLEVKLLLL